MLRILTAAVLLFGAGCNERRPAPTNTAEKDKVLETTHKQEANKMEKESKKAPSVDGAFPSQVAGSFYTANEKELRFEVEKYINEATVNPALADRDIVGILAPHAGYVYSGPVAGYSYRAVKGRDYKTVVVMALSHSQATSKAAVLNRSVYSTPLGPLNIDRNTIKTLLDKHGDVFEDNEGMFKAEHSMEVQLPFIKVSLGDVAIVPIIVAVYDDEVIAKIGAALYKELGSRNDVLFVMSSDMSHFLSYDKAQTIDNKTLSLLEEWKLDQWRAAASMRSEGMCGYRPIKAFLSMFESYDREKRKVTKLIYKNSGDTAGDKSRVVGYGSVVFSLPVGVRTQQQVTEAAKDIKSNKFGPFGIEQRRYIISLAKKAVAAASRGESFEPEQPSEKILSDNGAAFVTLKKHSELRGCIGHVIARIPLYKCIADVAKSAAIYDTRFSPVRPDELSDLEYEISVLTTPKPIKPADVVVGRDGLIMSRGGRSGLLLPQVPIEWGWDCEEFLSSTCRKAGLPLDCWKDPETKIEAFQAIVWGERDI